MKAAGAPTLFVIDDDAACACGRPGGARRSVGLNYRTDFVTAYGLGGRTSRPPFAAVIGAAGPAQVS
jgi:hypothetical protein